MSRFGAVSPQQGQLAVDARRLWGGGVATALVAALVAATGVLVFRDVFDIRPVRTPVLLNLSDSLVNDYALTAFVLGLLATAVTHGLVLATPRPRMFFGWIVGLATVAGAVAPFAVDATLERQLATAFLNLVLGICVASLLSGVMSRTVYPVRTTPRPGTAMM